MSRPNGVAKGLRNLLVIAVLLFLAAFALSQL